MYEIIIANTAVRQCNTESEVLVVVGQAQALYGAGVSIKVNDVQPTYDAQNEVVGMVTKRVAEYPG
jgi:hypothetical protein